MNPVVMNQVRQHREEALQRNSRLKQPGNSLFGFQDRKLTSRTLSVDKQNNFVVLKKDREFSRQQRTGI